MRYLMFFVLSLALWAPASAVAKTVRTCQCPPSGTNNTNNHTNGYTNSTNGYSNNTNGYTNSTNGYSNNTNGYTNSTNGYSNNTNGYTNSTNGYSNNTNGYTNSTNGYSNNTNGYTNSTNGYSNNTNGTNNCICDPDDRKTVDDTFFPTDSVDEGSGPKDYVGGCASTTGDASPLVIILLAMFLSMGVRRLSHHEK